jgi:hypothetical protein
MHNCGELGKDVAVRFGRVGVVADCGFDDGEAEGPHVGRGGVRGRGAHGFAFDAFGLCREEREECQYQQPEA